LKNLFQNAFAEEKCLRNPELDYTIAYIAC